MTTETQTNGQIEIEIENETIIPKPINEPLSIFKLWLFLILCILFYGFGIFIVYIPNKIYGIPLENSLSIISFSRLLGILFLTLLTTNLKLIRNLKKVITTTKNKRSILLAFMTPSLNTCGYLTYNLLVKRNVNISIVSSISNMYILIPVMYGIVVLKDKITVYKCVGFLMMFVGVILLGIGDISKNVNDESGNDDNNSTVTIINEVEVNKLVFVDVLILLSTIFIWGFSSVFRIYSLKRIEYSYFMFISLAGQIFIFLMSLIYHFLMDVHIDVWTLCVIAGHFIICLGTILSVIITSDSDASKWSALTQLSVLITAFMSIIVFKEPVTVLIIIGISMLVIAGILISKK